MADIVQRTCMGCNCKKDKKDFLRIVKNLNDNQINLDLEGKAQARGAYICNNEACLNKLVKNKRLERVLKIKINEDNYEKIRGVAFGKE